MPAKRVMVVDDDKIGLFSVSAYLRRRAFEVQTAESGQDALEYFRTGGGTDLVLLDIRMPIMDGFETVRRMRTLPDLERTPIVAFTADAVDGQREKSLRAGFSDYLAKPVDPQVLLATVMRWLGGGAATVAS